MGTTVSLGTVLFSDDFATDTVVDPTTWSYVQYEPANNPAFLGRTETNQSLPLIVNGAAHLTLDTYNPISPGTGNSFAGTAIYTQQTFQPGSTGVVFQVVAKLDQTEVGLVGGIFPYALLDASSTDHNEIDTELVSNDPTYLSANNYADEPLGAGHSQTLSLPAGDSITDWNTYQMVWTPSEISWYVNGTQVGDTTSNVPTGLMPLYLNFWAPGNGPDGWDYAYNAALQPVDTAAADTTYGFDVSSVEVAQLAQCFVTGTRIAVEHGEVAVEAIRIGQRVRVLFGGDLAEVIWVGQREVDCARHPQPRKVWPVRVTAGAFGPGRPHCDLLLSPDHAIFVEGVLIPVKHLINGSSITQLRVGWVTYRHLELAQHNVLLAEGLPTESFLDVKDRFKYARAQPARLYPNFCVSMWEAFGCAPLIVTGPKLLAARTLVRRFAAEQAAAA